jgi:hypothetical protein
MTEPLKLLCKGRAEEIAGEFYPNGPDVDEEPVEPAIGQSERDEQLARICELARRLGFNDAKTEMLIGQSAGDLAGLERMLLNELDDQSSRKSAGNGDNGHRRQPKKETSQTSKAATSQAPNRVPPDGLTPHEGGFLF